MFANEDLSGALKKVQARALNVEPIGQLLTCGVALRAEGENYLALEQTSGGPLLRFRQYANSFISMGHVCV